MSPVEQRNLVKRLVDHPYDSNVLDEIRAEGLEQSDYASLLEEAAALATTSEATSYFLTEAAAVYQRLEDGNRTRALLTSALEADPLNARAADAMAEAYRTDEDQELLADLLWRRAEAVEALCGEDPSLRTHAAEAYEALGVHLAERVGSPERAVMALRHALAIQRGERSRYQPSAPPRQVRESPAPPKSDVRTRGPESALLPPPRGSARPSSPATPEASSETWATGPTQVDGLRPSASDPPDSEAGRTLRPPAPDDRLIGLFEALHALRLCHDALEAAALVVQVAIDALDAKSGMVHLYDAVTREYVVSAALGDEHRDLVGMRTPEADPLLERATRLTSALQAKRVNSRSLLCGDRFRILQVRRAVLCAPAQLDGIVHGAIELVDPKGRGHFDVQDRDALTYVGERLAEFLAESAPVLG